MHTRPRRARRFDRTLWAMAAMVLWVALVPLVAGGSGRPAQASVGRGYWMVASNGAVFSFGDAGFHGSAGTFELTKPIVGMASTPSGRGYWLVASDGGIFSFGDAGFFGSTGAIRLNKPIVGMASTPSGRGYWLVASDGGIFSYGDAGFLGSTGSLQLVAPVTGMAATPAGHGYWLLATDGGLFSFGDAGYFGSVAGTAGRAGAGRVTGMVPTPSGRGYWQVTETGEVFPFGDAERLGTAGAIGAAIVGVAAFKQPEPVPAGPPTTGAPSAPDAAAPTEPTPTTTATSPPAPVMPDTSPPTTAPPMHPAADPEAPYSPYGTTPCGVDLTRPTKIEASVPPRLFGELSGLATSKRYPGVAWAIRDSGHEPSIFALRVDATGQPTAREIPVAGADNQDWEDLSYRLGPDGLGRLLVVESGQGGRSPSIYEIAEPDPDVATSAKLLGRYPYAYPDKKANTEASFVYQGQLVLATKTFPARLYRFERPFTTGAVNRPTFVGKLTWSKGISVAKASEDGRLLVTATQDTVAVYCQAGPPTLAGFVDRPQDGLAFAFPLDNVESGDFFAFGEYRLLFVAESKTVYWMRAAF